MIAVVTQRPGVQSGEVGALSAWWCVLFETVEASWRSLWKVEASRGPFGVWWHTNYAGKP